MNDFFRVIRGLEIDERIRILHGTPPPGGTPDTDSAIVGSVYLENTNGNLYTKVLPGSGTNKWSSVQELPLKLYDENPNNPTPPAAAGVNSVAIGPGAQTALAATNSIALGDQSLSRHPNGIVQAGGRFASTGDAQVGTYLLRGHTVGNVETEIFLDGTGGSQRLVMPDDATWTFSATITGHRTDIGDGHAGYKIEGVAYRNAGAASITILGNPTVSVLAETNRQWEVRVYADTVAGALTFTCIGQTGKTIRWLAKVETVEVTN